MLTFVRSAIALVCTLASMLHSGTVGNVLTQWRYAGWALCGHLAPGEGSPAAGAASEEPCTAEPESAGTGAPADVLSRDERQRIGMLCKRLIDYGRLQWLRQQGFEAEAVCFVDSAVSGENMLLLGAR